MIGFTGLLASAQAALPVGEGDGPAVEATDTAYVTASLTADGTALENFNDLDGAFVVTNGEVRRSEHEGIYTEDRHYITTTGSDYLLSDWIYEVTVRSPSDGPPDILFIGIGSGRPDPTYFNEPANSLMFRIHQGWVGGRVDVAAHPTGPGPNFTYFAEAVGALPADNCRDFTEFTVQITKVGNTLEFGICQRPSDSGPCEPELLDQIPDLSAAAPFLSSGNTYLFFGNGSGSYAFTRVTIFPTAANDSVSGSESNGDSGGGSIDALLALLLAHFAFARALRRRIRPAQMTGPT